MTVQEYREQTEQAIQIEVQSRSSSALPTAEEAARSLDIARDPNKRPSERKAALRAGADILHGSSEVIRTAFEIMEDSMQPTDLRREALLLLKKLEFASPALAVLTPDYLEMLRPIIRDPDAELRHAALETLAQHKDRDTQLVLLDGLKDPGSAAVDPIIALQMLSYDIHVGLFPVVRDVAQTAQNETVRIEAVKLLSADSASKELLASIFRDKAEHSEVRRASAAALHTVAPSEFEQHARTVTLDDSDDLEVRATALNGLDHFGNRAVLQKDATLTQCVEELSNAPAGTSLRKIARRYLARHASEG